MDGESPFDRMLTSLRSNLGRRIPGGLNDVADSRLHRTLTHYVKEVARVSGMIDEREILRETFDSMASWFHRNTDQLYSASSPPPRRRYAVSAPPIIEHAVSPEPGGLGSVGGSAAPSSYDYDEDPLILFERMRAQRATMPLFAAPSAATPDLTAVETRRPGATAGAGAQPKDFLQPQEDIVKYRENEYNLVLNSKDRDWLVDAGQNRYNFSVQLAAGNIEQGKTVQAMLQTRLRNIVRIEFIKAILPVEGLDLVVGNDCPSSGPPQGTDTNSFQSVLGLPFVQVTMDEIQGNNVTTNSELDRSLAVCQYDSTWRSDTITTTTRVNRGYTLFFPKFMKAQRIYAPTPLANLQKMTFTVLSPENQIVSESSDSSRIKRILYSSDISGGCYGEEPLDASGASYLFIEATTWFSQWAYLRPDRIKFAGLSFLDAQGSAGALFRSWLEQEQGHTVIGLAHTSKTGTPVTVTDGHNAYGYANWIIIRNRFTDASVTGTPSRYLFAGTGAAEVTFASALTTATATGGVLNLNRQVQLFLRVITRDMDAATNIRPDNV